MDMDIKKQTEFILVGILCEVMGLVKWELFFNTKDTKTTKDRKEHQSKKLLRARSVLCVNAFLFE